MWTVPATLTPALSRGEKGVNSLLLLQLPRRKAPIDLQPRFMSADYSL